MGIGRRRVLPALCLAWLWVGPLIPRLVERAIDPRDVQPLLKYYATLALATAMAVLTIRLPRLRWLYLAASVALLVPLFFLSIGDILILAPYLVLVGSVVYAAGAAARARARRSPARERPT